MLAAGDWTVSRPGFEDPVAAARAHFVVADAADEEFDVRVHVTGLLAVWAGLVGCRDGEGIILDVAHGCGRHGLR